MDPEEFHRRQVVRVFAERRRKSIVATVVFMSVVAFAVCAFATLGERDDRLVGGMALLLLVATFAYIAVLLYSWRCPACSSRIVEGFGVRFCPSCGASFKNSNVEAARGVRPIPDERTQALVVDIFARRQKLRWLFVGPFFLLWFMVKLSREKEFVLGMPKNVAMNATFGLLLIAFVFSVFRWRCPWCGRHLGRHWKPHHCRNCGVRLQ